MNRTINDELYCSVRDAVTDIWDPLGLGADLAKQSKEYDTYLVRLCELLQQDVSEQKVYEYLWQVETDAIGLSGDREMTKSFASHIFNMSKSILNKDNYGIELH